MDYPEYIKVEGKEYKINTNFRVAIKCNQLAEDNNVKNYERALGIICMLFGNEAIDDAEKNPDLYEKFLKCALIYMGCGKVVESNNKEQPDMDFVEDYSYIKTSFRSDFQIDLDKENMHWYEFMDLINGLSNSEIGNCCILNRIRNLRNLDLSKIKDSKERNRLKEAKEKVVLKKYSKEYNLTKEQEKSMEELNKLIGL